MDVVAYASAGGVFWSGSGTTNPGANDDPYVSISATRSGYADLNRPMNREWHEFGHHVMADMFADLMPRSRNDNNHGGYNNPSTTDSWTEGFAEFYALAVAKYIAAHPKPHIYAIIDLEQNFRAWIKEELAVAGLLWDLIDPADARDVSILGGETYADCVEISIGALWTLLDTDWGDAVPKSGTAPPDYGYIFDVKHLYDVLVLQDVGAQHSRQLPITDLDELFVAHGFFADVNNSGGLDDGEEIGRAADQAQPHRRHLPQTPGSYVRFSAIDAETGAPATVDRFIVDVRFDPPFDYFNYSVETRPEPDGRLYYYGPDPQYPATTFITAHSGDKVSVEPLSFSNQFYWQQMAAGPEDNFIEHEFSLGAAQRLFLPALFSRGSGRTNRAASQGPIPCAPATPTPTPTVTPTPTATADNGAPLVDGISPNSTQQGVAVQVTIKGRNFQPGANPFIGSTPLQGVTQPDTETLIGTVPGTLAAGTYDVVVVNPGGLTNKLTGGFTVTAGTSAPTSTPTSTPTPTPTSTPMSTPTPEPGDTPDATVLASDNFDRANADRCSLGSTNGFGGGEVYYYLPVWHGGDGDPGNPTGANIVDNALQNNGQDFGGVMVTDAPGACDNTAIRGVDLGQDLYVRVDVLVPTDASGRITEAGPFLRGRAAARGDGLMGGSNTGFWAVLDSTGRLRILDLSDGSVVAEQVISPFDPSQFYTVELAAQGDSIQARVSGSARSIASNGVHANPTQQPIIAATRQTSRTSADTDGTVGVSFGASSNRGQIGGQRADNLVITEYRPLD